MNKIALSKNLWRTLKKVWRIRLVFVQRLTSWISCQGHTKIPGYSCRESYKDHRRLSRKSRIPTRKLRNPGILPGNQEFSGFLTGDSRFSRKSNTECIYRECLENVKGLWKDFKCLFFLYFDGAWKTAITLIIRVTKFWRSFPKYGTIYSMSRWNMNNSYENWLDSTWVCCLTVERPRKVKRGLKND